MRDQLWVSLNSSRYDKRGLSSIPGPASVVTAWTGIGLRSFPASSCPGLRSFGRATSIIQVSPLDLTARSTGDKSSFNAIGKRHQLTWGVMTTLQLWTIHNIAQNQRHLRIQMRIYEMYFPEHNKHGVLSAVALPDQWPVLALSSPYHHITRPSPVTIIFHICLYTLTHYHIIAKSDSPTGFSVKVQFQPIRKACDVPFLYS